MGETTTLLEVVSLATLTNPQRVSIMYWYWPDLKLDGCVRQNTAITRRCISKDKQTRQLDSEASKQRASSLRSKLMRFLPASHVLPSGVSGDGFCNFEDMRHEVVDSVRVMQSTLLFPLQTKRGKGTAWNPISAHYSDAYTYLPAAVTCMNLYWSGQWSVTWTSLTGRMHNLITRGLQNEFFGASCWEFDVGLLT